MKRKVKKIVKITTIPIIVFAVGNMLVYLYCLITPKIELNKSQSYYLYDNKSDLVFQTDEDWINLKNINKNLINATLATEDKYFYKHIGFDYARILKAAINNIVKRNKSEGASTITQQYARNLFLNFERSTNSL